MPKKPSLVLDKDILQNVLKSLRNYKDVGLKFCS